MVEKFFSNPKRVILIAGAIIVAAFVCVTAVSTMGWLVFREEGAPEPTVVPVSIGYCGENLTGLCVVSFSRDVFGDTVINLYVPVRRYAVFYLNIIRQSGASRFECEWDRHIRTSARCTGEAINLGEGFEIQILSLKDDELVAQGPFTLTAFLVTTQVADGDAVSETPEPPSTFRENATATSTETPEEATPTFTSTSTEELTVPPTITYTVTP